jgi:hypothetical protein
MKPRIAFLFCGQSRSNSLNSNYSADTIILDSYKQFLFTDAFESRYEYDVFFSVDSIDIDLAKNFFGDHLKNIHFTESGFLLHEITTDLSSYDTYLSDYRERTKYLPEYCNYENTLYQYYRLRCAFMIMKSENIQYDYIVRMRPDMRIIKNMITMFDEIESNDLKIIMEHENICIMKPELEDLCRIIEFYGMYTEDTNLKKEIYRHLTHSPELIGYHGDNALICLCPEKQLLDHIYYIFKLKKFDFSRSFRGIRYPEYNAIYRGNGKYGYTDMKFDS